MSRILLQVVTSLTLIVVLLGVLTVPTSATIEIDHEVNYDGLEGDDEQAVRVNVTIEPSVVTEDLEITVDGSPGTLLDPNTLSSPEPAVTRNGENEFFIDEIKPGNTIRLTFEVYPKSLQEAEQRVAIVRWRSEQQPDLQTEILTTNLSNSPILQLQDAQGQIEELESTTAELESEKESLESEIDRIEWWRLVGIVLAGGGIVVALGALGGAYVWQKRQKNTLRETVIEDLDNTLDDINKETAPRHTNSDYEDGRDKAAEHLKNRIEKFAKEWNLPYDSGGFGSDSPADNQSPPSEGPDDGGLGSGSLGDDSDR